MKSNSRATATGTTVMSQGEPMVWLTGGMFAIACTMIVTLLSFILYQGLATHWQRPFAIYSLNSGGILAGELQNEQPYTISKQSLSELDDVSRKIAEDLLAGREQTVSTQLYLRTGNYDVGNRHFAFVPKIGLSSGKPFFPPDIWLLERREWGVLYGFPSGLKTRFAPEFDRDYSLLAILATQIDQFKTEPQSDADALKTKVASHLAMVAKKLTDEFHQRDLSTDTEAQLVGATQAAITLSLANQNQMEAAKQELGRTDRELSNGRLLIRKAELADKTDLQALADDAIQLASAEAAIKAQSKETLDAIAMWQNVFAADKDALRCLMAIQAEVSKQQDDTLQSIVEANDALKPTKESLPARSKRALETASAIARKTTEAQYEINTRIARLESISKSQVLEMQIPILETQPVDDSIANKISELKQTQDVVGAQGRKPIALSETQTMYPMSSDGSSPIYVFATSGSGNKPASGFSLQSKEVLVSDIVRVALPNRLGLFGKLKLYFERWFEFLFGQPREAGSEGGFFPAIWGTIVMTLIMSVAVMPFGVIAALYMREYAKNGWVMSLIRISINNLAGVPSIVYGVFGLAFFCYTIGGFIDGGPTKAGFVPWPSGTWFVALAATALAGTVAFIFAFLGSGSPTQISKSRKRIASFSGVFWLVCLIGLVALFAKSPFFNGFYEASLPNPTFGKGCLLWASCTLALLTLPVVIVATEEALSAVPNSLREGSYACGAGKWQTLQRIVLPFARPGIITGFILAMARGAGEVAPLMLVGAIPLATDLPLDLEFPFFHGSRSFMHLGFQIYSLGFQSQNSEAAKPMVFTATLLLLTIVTLLNVTAIWLRARLRKRFQSSQF
ncbi:MAG: ABC transporter permease subunit [Pirellula staleyi]